MTQVLLTPDAPMERPGVGIVISSAEAPTNPARGVVGYIGRARSGPLNTPVRLTNPSAVLRHFGGAPFGHAAGNTMDGACQALLGRATAVWAVRAGSGGTAASATLSAAVLPVLKFDASGPGTDGDNVSIALQGATDDPSRSFVIQLNGAERQRIRYTPPATATDEADVLLAAFNAVGSDYGTLSKLASGGPIDETPSTPLAGGADPTVTMADLVAALDALSVCPFECFATDSVDAATDDLVVGTADDWIFDGKLAMAFVGALEGTAWGNKVAAAQGFNNPAIVYAANGFLSNTPITGASDHVSSYLAAAREAGRHAALALGRQLTHARVPDAYQTLDEPPPDLVGEGLAAGLYLYTTAPQGAIWTEQGLTSQTNFGAPPPWAAQTDSGWGKSRLVLTRFRLLTDISLAWAPLIETTTNNQPGRDSIRKAAQNVIDSIYIPSGAVESGTVIEHPDYPATLDRATFLVAELVTPDGAEKLVLEARFRR